MSDEDDSPIDISKYTPPDWIDLSLPDPLNIEDIDFNEPAMLLMLQILLGLKGDSGPKSKTPWGIQLANKPSPAAVSSVLQRAADLLEAVCKLIATKTGWTVNSVRANFWKGFTASTKTHAPSSWNAFAQKEHKIAVEAAITSGEKPPTLPTFLKDNKGTLSEKYAKLSAEEKAALLKDFNDARAGAKKVQVSSQLTRPGLTKTIGAHAKHVRAILDELYDAANVRYLAFIVSGDTKLKFCPFFCASDGLGNIIANLTFHQKMPESMAKMIEGVYASGLSDAIDVSKFTQVKGQAFRGDSRGMMWTGYEQICAQKDPTTASKSKPRLFLTNYEERIVLKKGVALVGWPFKFPVCDIDGLDPTQQYLLNVTLCEKTCKWVILTPAELQARRLAFNMAHIKAIKSTAGQSKKRARREEEEEEEEDEGEEEEDEDE
ncbi:unnamed protein product [Peniophora sp. CBMAI 1063]|nr:unnamed protein product [Peniophora sp. CBMAI 1063]